jgi:hypothetical protein
VARAGRLHLTISMKFSSTNGRVPGPNHRAWMRVSRRIPRVARGQKREGSHHLTCVRVPWRSTGAACGRKSNLCVCPRHYRWSSQKLPERRQSAGPWNQNVPVGRWDRERTLRQVPGLPSPVSAWLIHNTSSGSYQYR